MTKIKVGFLLLAFAATGLWSSAGMAKEISPVPDEQGKVLKDAYFRNSREAQHRPKPRLARWVPSVRDQFRVNRHAPGKQMPALTYPDAILGAAGDSIYVRVNGVDADSITQGDDFFITVHFSPGITEADVSFWVDMNGNGTWEDTVDIDLEEEGHIEDNDDDDEDPAAGVYKITFQGELGEGPNRVANLALLIVAKETSGSDAAFLLIQPKQTQFSVSGKVTPAKANIIVGAFPWHERFRGDGAPWMTLTNASGDYQVFVPDSGSHIIFSQDFLGVTDHMFSDTLYFDVFVNGHLTGYDFTYLAPDAWITGTVKDDMGNPLEDVEVWAGRDFGQGVWTDTDVNGQYTLGVIEGQWWVGLDEDDLVPDYMVPFEEYTYVDNQATETIDFKAYSTDATITGTVYSDGSPADDIWVEADGSVGWTEAQSGSDGIYTLSVASAADDEWGYFVWVDTDDLPGDLLVAEYYDGVMSGATAIDFHLMQPTAWIDGTVKDEINSPIKGVWVHADQADGADNYAEDKTDESGKYTLGVLEGRWWVNPDSYNLIPDYVVPHGEEVHVTTGATETADFTAHSSDATIKGTVYWDDSPAGDVRVFADGSIGWTMTGSGGDGSYELSVSSAADADGGYHVNAEDWNLPPDVIVEEHYDSVMSASTGIDFHIRTVLGAIEGHVYDAVSNEPLDHAWVWVWNETTKWGRGTGTGDDGFYHMALLNGTYEVYAGAEGFDDQMITTVNVQDAVVDVEIFLGLLGIEDMAEIASRFELAQNFPNPFNPVTTVRYQLAMRSNVSLTIHDMLGRRIKRMVNNPQEAGYYILNWDGKDEKGSAVASGIYFSRLTAVPLGSEQSEFTQTRKMILLR